MKYYKKKKGMYHNKGIMKGNIEEASKGADKKMKDAIVGAEGKIKKKKKMYY